MSRTMKPFAFVGVIVGGLLAVAAVVFAYWSTSGSGSAAGSVSNLVAPSITSAASSADTVSLDWTDVLSPSGGAIDGYYVVRYAGATPSPACASSASTLLTSSTCSDTAVAAGTYTYRVTAVFNSWTAQSAPSGDVVVSVSAPVEPPTAAITFPGDGAFVNAAAFGAGCSPVGLCGTAADANNVAGVTVSIRQGSGNYWNGTAFGSATEVFQSAALANPGTASTGWAYGFARPADGSYTVRVRATDGNGTGYTSGYAATSTFTVDTVAPTAGALAVNGTAASTAGTSSYNKLGGYAIGQRTDYTDAGVGIASSTLTRADGALANDACSAYGAPNVLNGTPIQGSMATGCYLYTLTGTDKAGNTAAISTTVKVDTVAPSGGTIAANNGNAFNTTGSVALSVNSFGDVHSGISSNTITRAAGTLSGNTCGALSGSTVVTVSGGSDSATLTTGCYQYTLTGVDSAGNVAAVTSSVVKVDTAVPTDAITFPVDSRYYASAAWSSGCATAGLCGTATDTVSGVAAVAVSIRNAAGLYWNGSSFASATEAFQATALGANASGVRSWSYGMSAPSAGVYTVNVRTTDAAGNVTAAGSYTTSKFKIGTVGLALTSNTVSTNKRVSFSGTGGNAAGDTLSVSIKVCQVASSTSPAPDFSTCVAEDTVTGTVNALNGSITGAAGANNIGGNEWHYAKATQTDAAGNSWTFVYGPFDS